MAASAPVLGTTQDAPRPIIWTYDLTEEDEMEIQTAIEHVLGRTLVGRLVVREAKDAPLLQGATIPHGAVIRLQHMQTRRWLHSHLHQSPITENLEVSCFGAEGESDDGDLWILEIDGKYGVWTRDQRVRFQHIDTGAYLHSHDKKYARIAGGQQEVCGVRKKTPDNVWIAAEGVYLLPIEKTTEMEGP
ncbi:hypothetical protein L7F22_057566 [Adiantum nelumboides]|nr:hypothetical protein [Adiantum nelumboides]